VFVVVVKKKGDARGRTSHGGNVGGRRDVITRWNFGEIRDKRFSEIFL
jgi:hypothetical protein